MQLLENLNQSCMVFLGQISNSHGKNAQCNETKIEKRMMKTSY